MGADKNEIKKSIANAKLILGLSKEAGNAICADCNEAKSTHASITYGVFVCETCGATHTHGGAVIKEIAPCGLLDLLYDQRHTLFSDENVNALLQMGNKKGNSRFAMQAPLSTNPSVMVDYIQEKYGMTLAQPSRRSSRAGRKSRTSKNISPAESRSRPNSTVHGITPPTTKISNASSDYSELLQALKGMGFIHDDRNLVALQSTNGVIDLAVDILLAESNTTPINNNVTVDIFKNIPTTKSIADSEFKSKLAHLQAVGFSDDNLNQAALYRANGDMKLTVELIVSAKNRSNQANIPSQQPIFENVSEAQCNAFYISTNLMAPLQPHRMDDPSNQSANAMVMSRPQVASSNMYTATCNPTNEFDRVFGNLSYPNEAANVKERGPQGHPALQAQQFQESSIRANMGYGQSNNNSNARIFQAPNPSTEVPSYSRMTTSSSAASIVAMNSIKYAPMNSTAPMQQPVVAISFLPGSTALVPSTGMSRSQSNPFGAFKNNRNPFA